MGTALRVLLLKHDFPELHGHPRTGDCISQRLPCWLPRPALPRPLYQPPTRHHPPCCWILPPPPCPTDLPSALVPWGYQL